MSQNYEKELRTIEKACQDIVAHGTITDVQNARLAEQFGDRFKNALQLVLERKVHRFRFKPSGRVIWAVKGRKAVYQVIPETNFCNCDDYYFRVMNGQKALCYHIIAQRISSVLGNCETSDLKDTQYGRITQQWRKA